MSPRLLLCTDLDRTLLPNGPQSESPGARDALACLVSHPEVFLAYVSGRDRSLVEAAMAQWSLPRPDAVIGDVGTTLWHVPASGEWSQDAQWEAAIGDDWAGRTRQELAERLADLPVLQPQPEAQQNRHKLSFNLPADLADETRDCGDVLRTELHSRLAAAGVRARLIFSVDETRNEGLLDILPARASKLHAIEALMERLEVEDQQVVFCGDSGNDLEVLVSRLPAVLVGNATVAVREAALAGATAQGAPDRLYCAEGGFMGMNGHYAAGMLEGIAYFHPWVVSLLDAELGAA